MSMRRVFRGAVPLLAALVLARPGAAAPTAPRSQVVAAPVRPTLHPLTTGGPVGHSWPPAFLTCKEPDAPETKQAAYVEKPAATPASDEDASAAADLKRRVETLYGGGPI